MSVRVSRALLDDTRRMIQRGDVSAPLGAVCWSGGKDSMTLLHLLRTAEIELPVVFFREPWQPRKYAFHDQLIRDWELHVLSWHPSGVGYQQTGDEFELQNCYRLGTMEMTCPTGIVPPADGLPWACGVEMGTRPTQDGLDVYPHFQALWVGHKRSDCDVVLGGDAGSRIHARMRADGSRTFFPLRDWTDADVWDYIEEFDVPHDIERYEKHEGVWRERPHRRHNADYVHACTACMDRRAEAPRYVLCPKLGMTIENTAADLPWIEPVKLSYMQDDPRKQQQQPA